MPTMNESRVLPKAGSNIQYWKIFWDRISLVEKEKFEELILQYRQCIKFIDKLSLFEKFLAYDITDHLMCNIILQGFTLHLEERDGKNVSTTPKNINDVLSTISPINDSTEYNQPTVIQYINVAIEGKQSERSYFIADDLIKFRHQGKTEKKPPLVFLQNLDLEMYREQILVYYAASGSGKTVELASSSVTRNAHITFIFTVEDKSDEYVNLHFRHHIEHKWLLGEKKRKEDEFDKLHPIESNDEEKEKKRTEEKEKFLRQEKETYINREISTLYADLLLSSKLEKLVARVKEGLQCLIDAAIHHNDTLKVIVAIDEGSSCARVIRGLLRDTELSKRSVQEAFVRVLENTEKLKLDVKTSIAGTGLSSSTMGSVPRNFTVLSPFHELGGKLSHVDYHLRDLRKKLLVSWSPDWLTINSFNVVENYLPVVATLMQNGRMASIAIDELSTYNECDPIYESILVDKIVTRFMLSNGMNELVGKEFTKKRWQVAASALAVHLFGSMEHFHLKVPVSADKIQDFTRSMDFFPLASNDEDDVSIKEIVTSYGLLEPKSIIKVVKAGEKLVPPLRMTTAQQLVAAHMLGIGLDSMLEPSWVGFEVITTHFVNCAIAASIAVDVKKRPSLSNTLECLGFQVDFVSTCQDTVKEWKGMDEWIAIGTLPEKSQETILHSETRQLHSSLEIDELGYLRVNKMLYKSITSLKNDAAPFAKPIACLNYGNSNLPDGFVTFYARKRDSKEMAQKWSIMIQAKDYHGSSNINVTSLNEHAKNARKEALDGVFGKHRLLCVASSHESLLSQSSHAQKRSFIPYVFDKSKMLKDLLLTLRDKRSHRFRKETHSILCNKEGEIISDQFYTQPKDKRRRTN